jgi:outer membrane lipoprotein-sorting protein
MRLYIVLALTVGSLLAGEAPKDNGAKKEGEKLFHTMEEKLAKAKTLECVFDVKIDTLSYRGSLFLAEGNRARLEIQEAVKGQPIRVLMISDGTRQSFQDKGITHPQVGNTPKNLNAEILTWVARSGVFLPHTPLPDVRADNAKDRFPVWGFKPGNKEKVGAREAQPLAYQLSVKGLNNPLSATVWLDLKTGIPVKRQVTERVGAQQTTVVETYGKLTLDEKVDAKKFDLPK